MTPGLTPVCRLPGASDPMENRSSRSVPRCSVVETLARMATSTQLAAHAGVFVFSPEGKVVVTAASLGDRYSDIHDMKIREEADGEFVYGARNANAEGIKFNAETGDIVLKLPFPEESGLQADKIQANGDHRRSQRRHHPVGRLRE